MERACCRASAILGRLWIKELIWDPIEGSIKKRLVYKAKKTSNEVVRDNHLGNLKFSKVRTNPFNKKATTKLIRIGKRIPPKKKRSKNAPNKKRAK